VGEYDITMKHLIRVGGRAFLRQMGIVGELAPIRTEFPNSRERRVDHLSVLSPPDNQGRRLLQLEIQVSPDESMLTRMLGYHSDIMCWLHEEHRCGRFKETDRNLLQRVVYIGRRDWNPKSALNHDNLAFRYEFVDMRKLSSRTLLDTGDYGDAVLAILCADGTQPNVVESIKNKLEQLSSMEQADALGQLFILSQLRGVRPLIEQEFRTMGITVNVKDIPFLREPIDRARAEGRAEGEAKGLAMAIEVQLRTRFPREIPEGLVDYLSEFKPDTLLAILRRSQSAPSVKKALGRHKLPAKQITA